MTRSPIPILLILLLLRNRGGRRTPLLSTLELEALLDNARNVLNTLDRVNGFAHSPLAENLTRLQADSGGFPDMKKIMEIVEKIPL